jgi:carboxylesterase
VNWSELKLFQEPKHLAFLWPGGKPAALLVHGFPGTPAEMRPLARLLQPMGWTVQGLLLPGFGAQYHTLNEHRFEDWLAAVIDALQALRAAGHGPVMLAGYSMGAALAISAAAAEPPDALMLLAPFTWPQSPVSSAANIMMRPLAPARFRPFSRANFRDQRTRNLLLTVLPGMDLDDPEIQDGVRKLQVRVALVAQVFKAGWLAWLRASKLQMSTLVIQGRRDEAVSAVRTRLLVKRLGNVVRYLEVDASHRLIGEENLAWATVQEAVMDFTVRVEEGSLR